MRPRCLWLTLVPTTVMVLAVGRAGGPVIEDAHSRAFTVFNDLPLSPDPPLAIEDAHSRVFTVFNDLPRSPGPPLAIEDAHSRAFTVLNEVVDCNENGVPDDQEMAECVGNPDCADCNNNGLLDECDISSGSSRD